MSDQLLMGLIVLQTTILLAGVPWAFKMHGTLSAIAAKVKHLPDHEAYTKLVERISVLETKVAAR